MRLPGRARTLCTLLTTPSSTKSSVVSCSSSAPSTALSWNAATCCGRSSDCKNSDTPCTLQLATAPRGCLFDGFVPPAGGAAADWAPRLPGKSTRLTSHSAPRPTANRAPAASASSCADPDEEAAASSSGGGGASGRRPACGIASPERRSCVPLATVAVCRAVAKSVSQYHHRVETEARGRHRCCSAHAALKRAGRVHSDSCKTPLVLPAHGRGAAGRDGAHPRGSRGGVA